MKNITAMLILIPAILAGMENPVQLTPKGIARAEIFLRTLPFYKSLDEVRDAMETESDSEVEIFHLSAEAKQRFRETRANEKNESANQRIKSLAKNPNIQEAIDSIPLTAKSFLYTFLGQAPRNVAAGPNDAGYEADTETFLINKIDEFKSKLPKKRLL